MLTQYIDHLINKANYEILEDGSYYGEIPCVRGVWANEKTLAKCQQTLQEVIEEWLLIKLRRDEKLPVVQKINLNLVADQQSVFA